MNSSLMSKGVNAKRRSAPCLVSRRAIASWGFGEGRSPRFSLLANFRAVAYATLSGSDHGITFPPEYQIEQNNLGYAMTRIVPLLLLAPNLTFVILEL